MTRIHDLDEGRAALRDATGKVVLESPPGAAAFQGIGWWRELTRILRTEFPNAEFETVLDCGPSAGLALAAIRDGIPAIRVDLPPDILKKIAGIAAQAGIRVEG